ncbi:MAG: nucleotidyltransferase domain-containing protein, partial [Nanoarchaeota archaeon]
MYNLNSLSSHSKAIFLFGSILRKGKEARDVDVCIILKKSEDYKLLQGIIREINEKNRLKIDPLYLTEHEFEKKLIEKDKPLVEIIKSCLVVHGHELFVEVVKNV